MTPDIIFWILIGIIVLYASATLVRQFYGWRHEQRDAEEAALAALAPLSSEWHSNYPGIPDSWTNYSKISNSSSDRERIRIRHRGGAK